MSADVVLIFHEATRKLEPRLTQLVVDSPEAANFWFQASIDGLHLQGGVKGDSWILLVCVGKVTTDPQQLPALHKAIDRANRKKPKSITWASLVEQDCLLYAKAQLPHSHFDDDDPAFRVTLMETRVDETIRLAKHAVAHAVIDAHPAASP